MELPPERATVANQSLALSCNAVVLARESSAEQVNAREYISDTCSFIWNTATF